MDFNKNLVHVLSDPPEWNQYVASHFLEFPILMRHKLNQTYKKRRHVQPGFEMTIIHEGNAGLVVGNDIYMQSPGDIMLIPGRIPHQEVFINPEMKCRRTVICIDDTGLEAIDQSGLISLLGANLFADVDFCNFTLPTEAYLEVKRIILNMNEEIALKQTGWHQMVLSQVMNILGLLLRYMEKSSHEQKRVNPVKTTLSEKVDLCCKYIQDHLYEDISLHKMALMLSVSQEHLTRTFQQVKGMSYYQYVIMKRVLKSQQLLYDYPTMSLTDIAYSTGFSSSSQFSRLFKSNVGITPSRYRSHSHNKS